MEAVRTLPDLLAEATTRLAACGIESPRLDAEVLMAHAMGIDRGLLATRLAGAAPVGPEEAARFRTLVRRRALREPIAYITGHREFWSLDFEVTPAVLIPRPETEIVVEEALSVLPPPGAAPGVADVGTGCGAIAVALATERPDARVVAIDLSPEALEVAGRNLARHGVADRVELVAGDLLSPLLDRPAGDRPDIHLVVSNPPYVSPIEREALMPEVREHEPFTALFAGRQGMEVIDRLVSQAARLLRPGGWLVMEIASQRAADITRMLESGGLWQDPVVRDDYAGLPRVARARRSAAA